jgi:hypothetical protein
VLSFVPSTSASYHEEPMPMYQTGFKLTTNAVVAAAAAVLICCHYCRYYSCHC